MDLMNKVNSSLDNVTDLHIVGIVIAPDRMESFLQFVELIPSDSGLVYMITTYQNTPIIPLSLDSLSKHTNIPIVNTLHAVQLEADHIYMIPPDRNIMIDDGQLSMVDVQPSDQNMPMDRLFCSLVNYSERFVIGILFVGESVVNTLGIEMIRQANGFIIYHPDEIAATRNGEENIHHIINQSDYCIRVESMSKLIYEIIQYDISNPSIEDDRLALFALLNQTTGIDFTYYKKASIHRRIQRRMVMNGFNQLRDYNKFLQDKPKCLCHYSKLTLGEISGRTLIWPIS